GHGDQSGEDAEEDGITRLTKALRAAEERAQALERLLSETEERRMREETRARCLEERVVELEKVLSERQ
ncbi:unnamed protein product, partial [Pylaiella littoralis]